MSFINKNYLWSLLALFGVLLNGCASFGPNTVKSDRMGYVTAISDSRNTQMLLNLVKMRYGETPVFLEVASVINQYSVEGLVSLNHTWPVSTNSGAATMRYSDKPTITYNPLTGDKFTRSLLTPIQPSVVLNFIQSGKSPEVMLRFCVQSINGIQNQGTKFSADPRFERLITLLNEVQDAAGIIIKFGDKQNAGKTYMAINIDDDPNATIKSTEIRNILKLKSDANEFTVVYGNSSGSDTEIAMVTRSVFDIMTQMALSAEVPQIDIDEGRAYPSPPVLKEPAYKSLATIRSSKSRPSHAFVTVNYRGQWFWLDDNDLESKKGFNILLLMVNLAESGSSPVGPLVTLPSG